MLSMHRAFNLPSRFLQLWSRKANLIPLSRSNRLLKTSSWLITMRRKNQELGRGFKEVWEASCHSRSQSGGGIRRLWRYPKAAAWWEHPKADFSEGQPKMNGTQICLSQIVSDSKDPAIDRGLQNSRRWRWAKKDTTGFEVGELEVSSDVLQLAKEFCEQQCL